MEKIGIKLKDRRLELGLTIEDVSKHTRLTTKHIKAMEEGDMNFFHDDLSYLRFFVKSYCEAVDIDFEEIKDELRESVNDYTQTLSINTQITHKEIEKHITQSNKLTKVSSDDAIATKVRKTKTTHAHPHIGKKDLKKIDFSLVSLIAVVGVVGVILVCALVMFMQSGGSDDTKTQKDQPIADVQKKVEDTKAENKKENTKKKELEIVKNDVTHYAIDNVEEGDELTFEILFGGSSSGFSVTVDGNVLNNPAAKVYEYGTTATAKIIANKGMNIQFYIGWMNNVSIKVNGKNVKVDDSIMNSNATTTLEFSVEGAE